MEKMKKGKNLIFKINFRNILIIAIWHYIIKLKTRNIYIKKYVFTIIFLILIYFLYKKNLNIYFI